MAQRPVPAVHATHARGGGGRGCHLLRASGGRGHHSVSVALSKRLLAFSLDTGCRLHAGRQGEGAGQAR